MHIAIKANEAQKNALLAKTIPAGITVVWLGEADVLGAVVADTYFDLFFDNEFLTENDFIAGKPVFVNAVCCTTTEIGHTNYVRLNGWNTFLERPVLEIALQDNSARANAEQVLQQLGWGYIWAPDQPGMVAPRVISMVINEAFFSLQEGVSTKAAIDTAMKLGTNYPFGPFEWAEKIGLQNVYFLLKKLQQQNSGRYSIAPLLQQQATENGTTA